MKMVILQSLWRIISYEIGDPQVVIVLFRNLPNIQMTKVKIATKIT